MKTKSVVLKEFQQVLETVYIGQTPKNYTRYVSKFLDHANKPPLRVTNEDVLNYRISIRNYGYSYKNAAINAVKSYFKLYLNRQVKVFAFRRPRKEKVLPKNIAHKILGPAIANTGNLKAKLILSLGYGCGLRSNEVINLKLSDISLKDRTILIKGKGAKERIVPFSNDMAVLQVQYWRIYKSVEYLFNGRNNAGRMTLQYSKSSILKLVKQHIGDYTFHQLRHSYATRLLEQGVDVATVSRLLGHQDVRTTMVYNHILTQELHHLPLPL